MSTGLQSYLREGAQAVVPDSPELPPATGYVVVYARNVQWDQPWPPFDQFYGVEAPAHVVRIHGIDYAWIYRAPPPVAERRDADFGPLHLRGYTLAAAPKRGQPLALHIAWKATQPPPADYMLFAHLIGADGKRYAQADLAYPTRGWPTGQYQQTELALPLPSDLPTGSYRLVVGMYDPSSGQRLPLQAKEPIDAALDGPDALPLIQFDVK
jgi:hypothetical protein